MSLIYSDLFLNHLSNTLVKFIFKISDICNVICNNITLWRIYPTLIAFSLSYLYKLRYQEREINLF